MMELEEALVPFDSGLGGAVQWRSLLDPKCVARLAWEVGLLIKGLKRCEVKRRQQED